MSTTAWQPSRRLCAGFRPHDVGPEGEEMRTTALLHQQRTGQGGREADGQIAGRRPSVPCGHHLRHRVQEGPPPEGIADAALHVITLPEHDWPP